MTDKPSPAIDQAARTHEQTAENTDAETLPDEFPDKPVASFAHGTTEREQREGESLDDKLSRERQDGTDPLQTESTQLLDDAGADGRDREKDLVAEQSLTAPDVDDSGQPRVPKAAEDAALHIERD